MFDDEKEKLQPKIEDKSDDIMEKPQVLQHSEEIVMQKPIKLNESINK